MKFDCGETSFERYKRLTKWHRWFAWRPVEVGPHDCRWLEYVERKGTLCLTKLYSWWRWEYKESTK